MKTMKRMARPKGKKFRPVTISLTEEQIAYLDAQPNASETIRKVLDDLILASKDAEANLGVISLKKQLDALEEERITLNMECDNFFDDNKKYWKRYEDDPNEIEYEGAIPKPKDKAEWLNQERITPENAQIAVKVYKGYFKAVKSIEQRISEIKQKILSSE